MRAIYNAVIIILLLITASSYADSTDIKLSVYKNQQCGCCGKWITHMENSGFKIDAHNLDSTQLSELKDKHTIHNHYQSCHTGIYEDKYVFEGHVPAKFVSQFLQERPKDAIGLSVPAMPVGTPGMEVGKKFSPYNILLLKNDGTHEVYAHINNYEEQF